MERVFKKGMSFDRAETGQPITLSAFRLIIIVFLAMAGVATIGVAILLSQPTAAEQNAAVCIRTLKASLENPETLTVHEIQYDPHALELPLTKDSPESGDIMICYTAEDASGIVVTGYAVFGSGGYYGDYYPDDSGQFESVARYSALTAWNNDQNIKLDVGKILDSMK